MLQWKCSKGERGQELKPLPEYFGIIIMEMIQRVKIKNKENRSQPNMFYHKTFRGFITEFMCWKNAEQKTLAAKYMCYRFYWLFSFIVMRKLKKGLILSCLGTTQCEIDFGSSLFSYWQFFSGQIPVKNYFIKM